MLTFEYRGSDRTSSLRTIRIRKQKWNKTLVEVYSNNGASFKNRAQVAVLSAFFQTLQASAGDLWKTGVPFRPASFHPGPLCAPSVPLRPARSPHGTRAAIPSGACPILLRSVPSWNTSPVSHRTTGFRPVNRSENRHFFSCSSPPAPSAFSPQAIGSFPAGKPFVHGNCTRIHDPDPLKPLPAPL